MKKRSERRIQTVSTPGLAFQICAATAAPPITTKEAEALGKAAYEACASVATETNVAPVSQRRKTNGKAK
jgi:hypothetical protein